MTELRTVTQLGLDVKHRLLPDIGISSNRDWTDPNDARVGTVAVEV